MTALAPYLAVAPQLTAQSVERCPDRATARAQMLAQIGGLAPTLKAVKAFTEGYAGLPLRLVVLPEYWLTSFPGRETIPGFAEKAALDPGGPEYAAMGRVADGLGVFLAGNAYETDTNFPGLYFQTSFVIAPSGEVILRYRRLNSMFAPTPHDVLSRFLDIYGADALFPVARTEIGNLAAIASEEILYPEIARAHALKGAELFVHSSSEIGSPEPTHKAIARRARAFENLAYVVSANTAGISGTALPLQSADGQSAVIDPAGRVLALSNPGETFTAFAEIDIAALRDRRRRPGMTNYLARQRLEPFASVYAGTMHPADGLISDNAIRVPERTYFRDAQLRTIEHLAKEGLI